MQRTVYERYICDGFRNTKVEGIVATIQGRRLFAGTNEGQLTLYECRLDNTSIGKSYGCRVLETIRKTSKDKKPISHLTNVESWRLIIGIMDGAVVAYDSQFYQQLGIISDPKSSANLFSVNEKCNNLVVAFKKKLVQYVWQPPGGFSFRKEFATSDIPKSMCYIKNGVILAYKKYYECLDLNTGNTSRILDVDKEHKMVIVNFPKSSLREETILLSLGTNGVFLDAEEVLKGTSFAFGSSKEERIEWAAAPVSVDLMSPFILSVLSDSTIEIHSLANLMSLQRISIASPSPHNLTLSVCFDDQNGPSASATSPFAQHAYICNGEQLSILKMLPLSIQVESLSSAGQYEEAINICQVCDNPSLIASIDVANLYELSAFSMLNRGDFEKAVNHFILAKTDFLLVAASFTDFIPSSLLSAFSITQGKKLSGAVLQRAASAVVMLCDHYRDRFVRRAERAEKVRDTGFLASSSSVSKSAGAFSKGIVDEDDEYIANPEEEILKGQLLDTMFLFALMGCSTSRKAAVIDLLKTPNRCQIESCSVLLASHGNSYTEALLWLYRSQNQHARVLQALSEDKCVALGAWSKDQFYKWTAEYLQWLWYHEEDITLPKLALHSLKMVIEYDAELGLAALVCRPSNKSSFGGKGVTISEVLNFLRSTSPKINYSRGALTFGASLLSGKKDRATANSDKVIASVLADTYLVNGHALGVAFLECLISSGEAPPNLHDEFGQLLVEGLPQDNELRVDHLKNDLESRTDDSEQLKLYKLYRRKLQTFLGDSNDYHPQKILKILPRMYVHENALVLSKLGRHREVLKIYLKQLRGQDLAESYCAKIFSIMNGDSDKKGAALPPASMNLSDPGQIYLTLFQVILEEDDDADEADKTESVRFVVSLAERYFDRFDVNAFIELLPQKTPVSLLLSYFLVVLESQSFRKRNLQIIHQLMRTREVYLRTVDANIPLPKT